MQNNPKVDQSIVQVNTLSPNTDFHLLVRALEDMKD